MVARTIVTGIAYMLGLYAGHKHEGDVPYVAVALVFAFVAAADVVVKRYTKGANDE